MDSLTITSLVFLAFSALAALYVSIITKKHKQKH